MKVTLRHGLRALHGFKIGKIYDAIVNDEGTGIYIKDENGKTTFYANPSFYKGDFTWFEEAIEQSEDDKFKELLLSE